MGQTLGNSIKVAKHSGSKQSRAEVDYPLNVYPNVYTDNISQANRTISDFSHSRAWEDLVRELEQNTSMVNTCRFPVDSESPSELNTPLHEAAYGGATKDVFEQLLKLGASKTLKTAQGETAYEIAKRLEMSEEILELIQVPTDISERYEEIQKMEAGLHDVIKKRVGGQLKENGQALPQLAFLYEIGDFWYPVPGFYGGFHVTKCDKGIESSSFCRIMGGSGQLHFINRKGKIKLKKDGFY